MTRMTWLMWEITTILELVQPRWVGPLRLNRTLKLTHPDMKYTMTEVKDASDFLVRDGIAEYRRAGNGHLYRFKERK